MVPADEMLAFGWFSKAAEQELSTAQCWMGKCYYFGNGTVQDWDEARKWFLASKENGNEDAEWWLDLLKKSNNVVFDKLNHEYTPIERLEAFSHLVEGQTDLAIGYRLTNYHSITDKQKINATKNFDERINVKEIFCVVDTGLLGTLKSGIVFTLHGVYVLEQFGKPFYFNYSDVDSVQVIPNQNGKGNQIESRIKIFLRDGKIFSLADTNIFNKYIFANIIDCLHCADKTWNSIKGHKYSGTVLETGLTEKQKQACDVIIHGASVAAGGVGTGLAQIPVIDTAVITPIQIAMITSLGAVFEIRVSEGMAKGIITSMGAAVIGRGVSQILVGWIPGLGNAFNTATAAGVTEAIGWAAVKHFCSLNAKDRAKYRIDGMQAGYEAASDEYAEKMHMQAEAFKKDRELLRKNIAGYQKLIKDYNDYITELKSDLEVNSGLIQRLQSELDELKALEVGASES